MSNEEPSEELIVNLEINSIIYNDNGAYHDVTTASSDTTLGLFKKTIGDYYGWNGLEKTCCDIYKVRGQVLDESCTL